MARFQLREVDIQAAMRVLAEGDRCIHRALGEFGPPAPRRQPTGFATLVRALTAQQLSGKAAETIYGRIVAHFGGELDPATVVRSRVSTLRRLGLSGRKAQSLRELAQATVRGVLQIDRFGRMSDREVTEQISGVKGFGVWSAQMYLIFSLGRPDVWPSDDLGVRKGMQKILQMREAPGTRELRDIGERYAPHRSTLALFCWHVQQADTAST